MKKELIRKKFFKLKLRGHSYNKCRIILKAKYDYEISTRTLQRWMHSLDKDDNWDLKDKSTRPKTIHRKVTSEIEEEIVSIKKKTGWGEKKIENFVEVSHWTINKILNKHKLIDSPKRKKKRNLEEPNILEERFIVQQLKEKLRDYFRPSRENLDSVMEIQSYGE